MVDNPAPQTRPSSSTGSEPARPFSRTLHRLARFDYSNPDHAYFVTICARRGTAPFSDPRLAKAIMDSLDWLREMRGVVIYACCLMPDHVHLLLRLTDDRRGLGTILGAFKSFTTRASWKLGFKGTLWQERFYDHIVRRSEDGHSIAEYIRQNPVRKGLVTDPDAYPWSWFPDPM